MKLGIQGSAWFDQWTKNPQSVISHVKEIGFDFIEIPLMNLKDLDVLELKKTLKNFQLDVCTSAILIGDSLDITSCDVENRRNGIDYLKKCIQATSGLGANFFSMLKSTSILSI